MLPGLADEAPTMGLGDCGLDWTLDGNALIDGLGDPIWNLEDKALAGGLGDCRLG